MALMMRADCQVMFSSITLDNYLLLWKSKVVLIKRMGLAVVVA